MFTGIVECTASVKSNTTGVLILERPPEFTDLRIGSSICTAGVCLTVSGLSEDSITFDMVSETLRSSTLGSLREGDAVNLERALRLGDRIGGHLVQGHTEGVGEVVRIQGSEYSIQLPANLLSSVIPKGSIAVDGVSLTVGSVGSDTVTIALIPETLRKTTLRSLRVGDEVNIETDILLRSPSALSKALSYASSR